MSSNHAMSSSIRASMSARLGVSAGKVWWMPMSRPHRDEGAQYGDVKPQFPIEPAAQL